MGEAETDKSGAYVITNAPDASDYVIVAWKNGYFEQKKTNQRPSSKTNFFLIPGGTVEGIVKDRITGRPVPGAKIQISSQYMVGVDGFGGTGVADEKGRFHIDGLKKQYVDPLSKETILVDDYIATVYAKGYPPVSKGDIAPDATVNFGLRAGEAGLSGTVLGLAADAVVLDVFESGGGFVKSVEIENNAFDVTDLSQSIAYQLRFTAYLPEGGIIQWAGENDMGFDDPDGESNPEAAKSYALPAEIAFRFTDGVVRTTRSANAPGPVRRLRSVSHVDKDAKTLRTGDEDEPAVSELFSPAMGTVSSNPNITVTWEPTGPQADEEYHCVFNEEPDFVIDRRTAPKEYPIRVRRATSRDLVGNDIPYYCHVAAIDRRGRIGATISLAFQIDTVPPSNAFVSTLSDAAEGFTKLQLGAVGAYEMNIGNIGFGQGGKWEKWTSTRDYKNPKTGGNNIYVQYRDRAKNTVNAMPFAEKAPGIIVTATAGPNGRIAPVGESEMEKGETLMFTLTPDTGYGVDTFLRDGMPETGLVGSYPSHTYRLTDIQENTALSVTFKEVWHTVTATTGPNGRIEPSGELVRRKDSDQTFAITPNPGYAIEAVLINGIPATPTDGNKLRLINITEDFKVSVTFHGVK